MSLTTESSLQRNSRIFSWRKLLCSCLCCPCYKKRIAPINPLPNDSDFITLGKKGKRVICVVHIDPCLAGDALLSPNGLTLFPFAKKVACNDNGYDSDTSNEEYWFSKWSRPLRTVKRFQAEHLKQQNIIGLIRSRLPAADKTKPETTTCDKETDLKVEQASQETATPEPAGVVNLAFVDSPSDPAVATVATVRQQVSSKPLLFFIHGAGESSESWKTIMHYFASLGYEVLAMDLLGHGFSHTPKLEKYYTFKKLLGDVLNVFDSHVSNGRKCAVIGHGYGCSFAVSLSRQRNSNVALLALLSSGGPTPLAPPVNWRREWKLPASLLRCMRNFLPCGMRRNVFYGPRGKSCLHDSVNFKSLPSYVQHHLAVGQTWPEGDVAFHRKIVIPTLLVHGLKDKFVSLVEMCELERTIPRAFLEVIPEAGHDVMSDVPDQLCKMLRKFLEHWQR